MYANLYGDRDLDRSYGEEAMFVSLKKFQTYTGHISDDVKIRERGSH